MTRVLYNAKIINNQKRINVSELLRTYPSPNPTLTLSCSQLIVVGLGRGRCAVAEVLTLIPENVKM